MHTTLKYCDTLRPETSEISVGYAAVLHKHSTEHYIFIRPTYWCTSPSNKKLFGGILWQIREREKAQTIMTTQLFGAGRQRGMKI